MTQRTKQELMPLIEKGVVFEAFIHPEFGSFNVTEARKLVARILEIPEESRPQWFGPHTIPLTPEMAHEVATGGDICEARIAALTDEQLEEPGISVLYELNETTGEAKSFQLDGAHRLTERFRRGLTTYTAYLLPLNITPRIVEQPGRIVVDLDWGDPAKNRSPFPRL